jgi:hypothetical protein
MKLGDLLKASDAVSALLPQITRNAKLAFKLSRLGERLQPDVAAFVKQRDEIFKRDGEEYVHVTFASPIFEDGAKLVAQKDGKLTYEMTPERWEALAAGYPSAMVTRGIYKIADKEKGAEATKVLEGLAETEVECPCPPISIELFEGVEADRLGQLIRDLGPFVSE